MTNHTISPRTAPSHDGLYEDDAYSCDCGADLAGRLAAEQHAAEQDLCTACLGSTVEPMAPGLPGDLTRGCTACAGTGRRKHQLVWALARAEAERVITVGMVQGVVAGFGGPFHLSEVADAVRSGLDLPGGRLPVGPRVRDVLLRMQAAGEITMLSAPDELLDGADVVLYRDPRWQRARTL
jgi:hypothetical protein